MSSCAPNGPDSKLEAQVQVHGKQVECAGWKPILVSPQDVLSEDTEREILSHNRFGVAKGCWEKPKK